MAGLTGGGSNMAGWMVWHCDYPGCKATLRMPYRVGIEEEAKRLDWLELVVPGSVWGAECYCPDHREGAILEKPTTTQKGNDMDERQPLEFEGRYLWHPLPAYGHLGDQFDYLPRDVFLLLKGYIPRDNPRTAERVRAYPTRDAAIAALTAALMER